MESREDKTTPESVRLAVVILNYGTPDLVADCLASLEAEVKALGARVVVVDNASPDDSVARIAATLDSNDWHAWATLLPSPDNHGFSAGNNLGIASIDAGVYLLLNSDTIVRPGALTPLVEAVEAGGGIASGTLEWPDGEPQANLRRWVSPLTEFTRAARIGRVARLLGTEPTDLAPLAERPRERWVSGACMAIHHAVVDALGGLDDGFFMYFEDMDYCRGAVEAGFDLAWVPESHVVHLKGGTSPVQAMAARREARPDYYYAARSRYFAKHYGIPGLIAANLAFDLGSAVSWLRETLGSKEPHLCQRESRDNWRFLTRARIPWRPTPRSGHG